MVSHTKLTIEINIDYLTMFDNNTQWYKIKLTKNNALYLILSKYLQYS